MRQVTFDAAANFYPSWCPDGRRLAFSSNRDGDWDIFVMDVDGSNVRQLVNEMSRIVAMADPDSPITPALLSPEIQASRRTVRVLPGDEPEIRVRLDQPLNVAVDAIERVMVTRALHRAHGNYENAAKLLGISRKGLFLKRRRWGMRRAS